ncbi:MAG: hypothetical protein ACTHMC_01320 [Pseudobacter sp.]|uniref:hypothetical protein n=1 Tax=Pseudobacter sp. TaxID=2045420 RepID=UPI003F80F86D
MPTKNQIIEELYRSKEFNDCIGKMQPEQLQDDLRSEVMLVLLETDEAKLKGMHDRGELKFYTVRVILNMIQSSTSAFYRKYRHINKAYVDDLNELAGNGWVFDRQLRETPRVEMEMPSTEDERQIREFKEERAMAAINDLYWYDREMVRLYMRLGNYRAIEKDTGIPWESCYSTIKKAIKKIRNELSVAHIVLFAVPGILLG